jgi:hypothetical protein
MNMAAPIRYPFTNIILTTLFLLFLLLGWQNVTFCGEKKEITGFGKLKWGISTEDALKVYPDFKCNEHKIYKWCTRTNEEYKIMDIKPNEVWYNFKKNKFNSVNILIVREYPENKNTVDNSANMMNMYDIETTYLGISLEIKSRYGNPKYENINEAIWYVKKVVVHLVKEISKEKTGILLQIVNTRMGINPKDFLF